MDDTYHYVTDIKIGASEMEKSRKMVDTLESKIKLDPSNLTQLLDILQEKKKYYREVIELLNPPIGRNSNKLFLLTILLL